MRRSDNAFEVLRANNPVDEATLSTGDSPKARALLAQVTATPRPVHQQVPRQASKRRRLVIAVAVISTLLTAAAWLMLRPVTDPISVACYQAASLDSDVVAVPSVGDLDASLCVAAWEDGVLVNPAVAAAGDTPPLLACVSESGGLAIFPSDDPALCSRLGLAEPDPESIPVGDAVRELTGDLIAYFADHECVQVADAERDIVQILSDRGFDDWHIQSSSGEPGRSCTSFGLDADTNTIHLIPIPPPDGAP